MRTIRNHLAGAAMAALATIAAATTTAASAASRYTIEQSCSDGSTDVLVVNWTGRGLVLYVYEGNQRVLADWATKRVIENSSMMTRIGYATSKSVFDGGANLRITTRRANFPQAAGTANLTYEGSNHLLQCDTN